MPPTYNVMESTFVPPSLAVVAMSSPQTWRVLWNYSEIVGVDVRGRPVRIDWLRLSVLIPVTINVGGQSVSPVIRSDNGEL